MKKLEMQPIPDSSQGKNLRILLGTEKWTEVSRKVREKADYTCEICGEKKESQAMHAHEVWSYNMKYEIQYLDGIMCVCDNCHGAIHYLRTRKEDPEKLQLVIKKYLTVNQCDKERLDRDKEEAKRLVSERSKINWKLDLSKVVDNKLVKLEDVNMEVLEKMSPGSAALLQERHIRLYIEDFSKERFFVNFDEIVNFIKSKGGQFDGENKKWYLIFSDTAEYRSPLLPSGELNLNHELVKELEFNSYKRGFVEGFNRAENKSIIRRFLSWFRKSE